MGRWFQIPDRMICWLEPGDHPSVWWPHVVVNPEHRGTIDLKEHWARLRGHAVAISPPGSVMFLASDPGGKADFFRSMGFVEFPGKNLFFMYEDA